MCPTAHRSGQGAPAASAPSATVASTVPAITGFSPSSGITGSAFTIEGSALASVCEVKLGAGCGYSGVSEAATTKTM